MKNMESKDYNPKTRRSGVTNRYVEYMLAELGWNYYTHPSPLYIDKSDCHFKKGSIIRMYAFPYPFIVKGVYQAKGQKRKNQMLVKLEKFQHEQ